MNRPRPPEDVVFPVVPMLDMSFQLLAFFIMTFQAPSRETRIDLDLPIAPVALPRSAETASNAPDILGLETDLIVRATAGANGQLTGLTLNEASVPSVTVLTDRLRRYRGIIESHDLRVTFVADDRLGFEEAAQVIGACSLAGVRTVRLAPGAGP